MKTALSAGTLALAVPRSQNEKLGECATTYAAQGSCPSDCAFFNGGGCYAESGQVGKFVTKPLNAAAGEATPIDIALAEAAAIDRMEVISGRPLRLHTVGDCATDEAASIVAAAAERYRERGGGPVWTYTHAFRVVERESWGRAVSVLASCETGGDVVLARSRGYAPSLVVEEFASDKLYDLAAQPAAFERLAGASARGTAEPVMGQRPGSGDAPVTSVPILPCPAQTHEGVSCSSCGLCFNDAGIRERGYAIGFALHGVPLAVRQARLALRHPTDPHRRVPSKLRLARARAAFLAAHGREPLVRELAGEVPGLNESSIAQWLRYLRGEIDHPSELRRRRRAA